MRKFIIKLLLFLGIGAAAFLIPCSVLYFWINTKNQSIRFPAEITTIICGDSHTQSAINDHLLKGSVNISQNSEHYLYTYNLLKLLLKNNAQIKTVVLGYSFHSLSSFYDNYIFDYGLSMNMYPRYFFILENPSKELLIRKNLNGFLNDFGEICMMGIKNAVNDKNNHSGFSFIGKYYSESKSNINAVTINSALQRHYYEGLRIQNFAVYQQYYLYKIEQLCQEKGVRLILINAPISNDYYNAIPKKFIKNYYSFAHCPQTKLFDYHNFPLADSCFGDGDHINSHGATIFTKELETRLNKTGNSVQ